MSTSNEKEIELWNGDVSTRWVTYQAELDRRLRPFGDAAIEGARLREGARVLDVGCGCGATTLAIAEKVGPTGHVVGLDVSAPMLARARERAAGLDHVRFELADATTFAAAHPFDAIVSRFGVMFFADPIASFANLGRLLVPGSGALSFVCWQDLSSNPWAHRPLSVVAPLVGPQPPADPLAPGPFSLGAEERVREVLGSAGFDAIELTPMRIPMGFGQTLDEAVVYAREMGPAARFLRGAEDSVRAEATRALTAMLETLSPPYELDTAVWRVTARR